MRLIYTEGSRKGKEVKVGDVFKNGLARFVVHSFPKPHKPASSGHVFLTRVDKYGKALEMEGNTRYYVSVIGAEWIEREDRIEERADQADQRIIEMESRERGLLDLLQHIADALGTGKSGNDLVEVARNAHAVEQELAALKKINTL